MRVARSRPTGAIGGWSATKQERWAHAEATAEGGVARQLLKATCSSFAPKPLSIELSPAAPHSAPARGYVGTPSCCCTACDNPQSGRLLRGRTTALARDSTRSTQCVHQGLLIAGHVDIEKLRSRTTAIEALASTGITWSDVTFESNSDRSCLALHPTIHAETRYSRTQFSPRSRLLPSSRSKHSTCFESAVDPSPAFGSRA